MLAGGEYILNGYCLSKNGVKCAVFKISDVKNIIFSRIIQVILSIIVYFTKQQTQDKGKSREKRLYTRARIRDTGVSQLAEIPTLFHEFS